MNMEYGEIKVGVEEFFWYDPETEVSNICRMCARCNCPVPDRDIVSNCNSFIFVAPEKEPKLATDWRIIQGMTVSNQPCAYMSSIASTT